MSEVTLTPMEKMIIECDNDITIIGERISAVLEFLTHRAVIDAPFAIYTDTGEAMVLFAANDAVKEITDRLDGMVIKNWDDALDEEDFLTDTDPGDEQEPTDESPAES